MDDSLLFFSSWVLDFLWSSVFCCTRKLLLGYAKGIDIGRDLLLNFTKTSISCFFKSHSCVFGRKTLWPFWSTVLRNVLSCRILFFLSCVPELQMSTYVFVASWFLVLIRIKRNSRIFARFADLIQGWPLLMDKFIMSFFAAPTIDVFFLLPKIRVFFRTLSSTQK